MSKRAPELRDMERYRHKIDWDYRSGYYHFLAIRDPFDGVWVYADRAEAAIHSQRVKMHRERAKLHDSERMCSGLIALNFDDPELAQWWFQKAKFHRKAAARFNSRADKIERGEL